MSDSPRVRRSLHTARWNIPVTTTKTHAFTVTEVLAPMTTVTWRYKVTLLAVAIGASFQFYTCAVVNGTQSVVQPWMQRVYEQRTNATPTVESMRTIWSVTSGCALFGAALGSLLTQRIADCIGV